MAEELIQKIETGDSVKVKQVLDEAVIETVGHPSPLLLSLTFSDSSNITCIPSLRPLPLSGSVKERELQHQLPL